MEFNNEPINVSNELKSFLTDSKTKFKRRFSKFYSIPSILMYYLNSNTEFAADFKKYCEDNGFKNDLEVIEWIKK